MKKRILSLLLVLCMVVLAVPVFALPASATTLPETYSTSFYPCDVDGTYDTASHFPTADANHTYVTYHGNWDVGRMDHSHGDSFYGFDYYNVDDTQIIESIYGDRWGSGGMYLSGDRGGEPGQMVAGYHNPAIRYKAEYTGTVSIDLETVKFRTTDIVCALFVNGVMVWPNDERNAAAHDTTYYNDTSKWYAPASTELIENPTAGAVTGISVNYGDSITFINRQKVDGTGGFGSNSYKITVTYTDITAKGYASDYASDIRTSMALLNYGNAMSYYSDKDADNNYLFETPEAYSEYLNTQRKILYTGNWAAGVINLTSGDFEPIARQIGFPDKKLDLTNHKVVNSSGADTTWDPNWAVTESAFQEQLAKFVAGNAAACWLNNSGVMFNHEETSFSVCQPSSNNAIYAYAFTAPEAGTASLSLNAVSIKDSMYICVLVDGCMVWPTAGGDITDKANWRCTGSATKDELNAELAAVNPYVSAGSRVEFCVKKSAWASSSESGNGFMLKPAISLASATTEKCVVEFATPAGLPLYRVVVDKDAAFPANPGILTTGFDMNGDGEADTLPATVTADVKLVATDFLGADGFATNAPTLDGTTVQFHSQWTIASGTWSTDSLQTAGNTWTFRKLLDTYANPAFVASDRGLWGADGGGMYAATRKFAPRQENSKIGLAAVYTAPATGKVDLTYTNLVSRIENNADQISGWKTAGKDVANRKTCYYISIVLNGDIIWPSNDTPWKCDGTIAYGETQMDGDENILARAQAYEAFPTDLAVKQGDELAFVVTAGNEYSWMFYMDPKVTYTALLTDATTEASVVVNEKFGVNFYVTADPTATGAGVKVGDDVMAGVLADGVYKVTLSGIAAKNLTDEVVVTPYQTVGGRDMEYPAVTTSVKDLLMTYVNGEDGTAKNLAVALLNYGAAAQTYFSYKTDALANADLTGDQKTVTHGNSYTDSLAVTGAENLAVTPTAMSLLLKDSVSIKLSVTMANDGVTGYKAQISTTSDFAEKTEVSLIGCPNGNGCYKAIFDGYMPDSWNTLYYLRVVDAEGAVVSKTVAYSVATYTCRVTSAEVKPVTDAMLAVYEAAVAYNA